MASKYSGKGDPLNGSVYVCNLPEGTDENMLAEHFGTIGLLKVGDPHLSSCFMVSVQHFPHCSSLYKANLQSECLNLAVCIKYFRKSCSFYYC